MGAANSVEEGYDSLIHVDPRREAALKALEESNGEDGVTRMMSGLVPSESMDMVNDPRMMTDNVLNKRLVALSSLALVSTVMTAITGGLIVAQKKDIELATIQGFCQFISLLLLNAILFSNLLATYIGIAQHYFAYRLMTAGPMGYEMASRFYLNPNITFWRHASIRLMLMSLPTFLMAGGLKQMVAFSQDMPGGEERFTAANHWTLARVGQVSVLGMVVMICWMLMALALCYADSKHRRVFAEAYGPARELEKPLMESVSRMASRGNSRPEI